MPIETLFREFIKRKSWKRTLLRNVGACYGWIIQLRHWLYDSGWIGQNRVAVPVISIGNIVVGGTGKTPLVLFLAQELSQFAKLAILSRGYRSKKEHMPGSTYVAIDSSPEECGDEPCLLAAKLPQVLVFVGKNRSVSAQDAVAHGAQLILLDDGMQHRRLSRDIEMIVIDAQDPFGQGFYLPGGLLRDHPKRLKKADMIVATNLQGLQQYQEIKMQLAQYTCAPVVGMQLKAEEDADFLREKKIGLFCAIGNPSRFQATIEGLGGALVDSLIANDHMFFSIQELESFAMQCYKKGAELLVCTEKDWIKLPANLKSVLPIYSISVQLAVVAGEEDWHHFIEKIKEKL